MGLLTWISCAVIIIVFGMFFVQAYKMRSFYTFIRKVDETGDILNKFDKTKLEALKNLYAKTIAIETENGKRTNTPAYDVFDDFNVCKAQGLNLRMLDTASGTLVGLGLLGTFLGLTVGINGFDSSTTDHIQSSIQGLLNGMGTAFSTSLIGMALSLIYTACDKVWRHRLNKHLQKMTNDLDDLYYIDDATLANINQKMLLDTLYNNVKQTIEQQSAAIISEFNGKLTYQSEEGHVMPMGNAIREILTENQQQTKALKSFSTDLAMELNNGFDETLSRQMQQKILPLMENIDATTRSVIDHIDRVTDSVTAPATDVIQTVIDELQKSMVALTQDFKQGMSGSLTTELETLATQLGASAQTLANMPTIMQNVTGSLQTTIDEVKTAVSEISNTSASANSTAMQQMQEQITFATGAISNAIQEVKIVMSGLTETSQEQSNQMVNKLADAAEKMSSFLSGTITTLASTVGDSVKGIAEDVNNQQANLLSLQEDTTAQTRTLLESFNTGLERLEKMNSYIQGTMDMFQQAQGQITGSTAHLQTITGDMKTATQLFSKSQSDYSAQMENMQRNSQRSIDAVSSLFKESGEMSKEYAEKFEAIKQGLGSIFTQLQSGLTEYSRTVQASTQKYLDLYTTSLTNTTDALSSTIQQQNEVVEMLVESINSRKI